MYLKDSIENEDFKPIIFADCFKHWLIIIGLAIASIVNLYIAIE
jgi:hypothetical protein